MNESDRIIARSVRRHLWGGGFFLCALLASGLAWAAWMEIAGAVIAPGTVVVESNTKKVQHREGGIVQDILVRNGDAVTAGALLLRLDDTVPRANLAVVSKQLDELLAVEARLIAERDGLETIDLPAELTERGQDVAGILRGQKALLAARRSSLAGRIDQLGEQVGQIRRQIEGLEVGLTAKVEEIELIAEELAAVEDLYEKNLVSINRVTALRRDRTRLGGERGSLMSEIARAGQAIAERKVQMLQIRETAQAEVLENLQKTRSEIARLSEQKIAAEDQMRRVDIRAPRAGFVHQLAVHTKGGVISPAEPLLLIVPKEDVLVIEAQVNPVDIDQIHAGQQATIRFPNFDQRSTPELKARVRTLSAETSRDETTGLVYYTARLALPETERARLGDNVLLPGMPVEVLIKTQDRTVLSYLTKPLTDQITHALKEE